MKHTEEEYIGAIELVVLGQQGFISDKFYEHEFLWGTDGDGWNEPESDWANCHCEQWEHAGWVQVDPERTGRPTIVDMVFEWAEHIHKDVFRVYDQEEEIFDGDLSQDTDLI